MAVAAPWENPGDLTCLQSEACPGTSRTPPATIDSARCSSCGRLKCRGGSDNMCRTGRMLPDPTTPITSRFQMYRTKQATSINSVEKFWGTCLGERSSSNWFLAEGLECPVQRLLCVCLDHSTNDISRQHTAVITESTKLFTILCWYCGDVGCKLCSLHKYPPIAFTYLHVAVFVPLQCFIHLIWYEMELCRTSASSRAFTRCRFDSVVAANSLGSPHAGNSAWYLKYDAAAHESKRAVRGTVWTKW